MEQKSITVLSFGGGQDSTTILYKLIYDQAFRSKYLKGELIVLMSDTGNEHPHTYTHIEFIKQFCFIHKIEFYLIDHTMGYHPKNWPTLQDQFLKYSTIMSVAFPKSCTDNLKIRPLYNFLDHYIATRYYGYSDQIPPKGKKYIKQFSRQYGKFNVLLGIALGEESRIKPSKKLKDRKVQLELFEELPHSYSTWMESSIYKIYPLITERLDRKACQQYILSIGLPLPFPSNCMFCPYASKIEILWLFRTYPKVFMDWVNFEKKKLHKFSTVSIKNNLGVKGKQTLQQFLDDAITEFGHLTMEQLSEYKMSHGHCVMSSY